MLDYICHMTSKVFYSRFLVCENIKILPNICDFVFGYGIDMVFSHRGNFEYYNFHIAQCLTSFLKHVSPLTSVA